MSHDPIDAVAIDRDGRVWILGDDPAGDAAFVCLDPSAVDEDGDWTDVEIFTSADLGFEPTGLALDHRDEIVIFDPAGRRHIRWDDDAEEAMIIDRLEAAISTGPATSAARALVTLGWKHKKAGLVEEAFAAFERAMSLDAGYHSSDAQLRLGVLHLEGGRPDVGVPLLEALVQSGAPHAKPANVELRFFRDREAQDSED